MSNTTNPLIDVEFIDQTRYVEVQDTDDVVAGVVDAPWGPVDTLVSVDGQSFEQVFNPTGSASNISLASMNNVFAKNGYLAEVVRPQGTSKYTGVAIAVTATSPWFSGTSKQTSTGELSPAPSTMEFRLKYPGGYDWFVIISPNPNMTKKTVLPVFNMALYFGDVTKINADGSLPSGVKPTEAPKLMETLVLSNQKVTYQGESYFYADVIQAQSKWLYANLDAPNVAVSPSFSSPIKLAQVATGYVPLSYKSQDLAASATLVYNAYDKFNDIERSTATLLIYTFPGMFATASSNNDDSIRKKLSKMANECMERIALVGLPANTYENANTEQEKQTKIVTAYNSFGEYDKFTAMIMAVERVMYNGQYYTLDGTAGWAGRIAYVAKNLRNRNALPSYIARGAYNGILTKTMSFKTVADVHKEVGVASIYNGVTTPYIFGIKTLFPNQTSYFNKLNFMRVVAAVLRVMFKAVSGVLHTDVASNPVSLSTFETQCNSYLMDFVSRQEIDGRSNVNLTQGGINDAANNNGGELLVVECELWGYKLAERAIIRVIATDSSVTAEIQ